MAKKAKKKRTASAPKRRATHERALKNRPVDNDELPPSNPDLEPPELDNGDGEGEETGEEDQEALRVAGAGKRKRGRPPKNPRLPGMEDAAIEELESAAEEYAEIRDQRMALTPEETRTKNNVLGLMKKHHKETYFHAGIEIELIHEQETVKVRVKKPEESS
jgi:hypothetical protein